MFSGESGKYHALVDPDPNRKYGVISSPWDLGIVQIIGLEHFLDLGDQIGRVCLHDLIVDRGAADCIVVVEDERFVLASG